MNNKKHSSKPNSNEQVSLVITRQYRHLVEFSLVGYDGLYEILKMYVEVIRMFRCVPSGIAAEAMAFRTNYTLTLVPDYKIYPLLPPTATNSRDTWTLKGTDIDLFGIHFNWPHMTSVEAVIKAEVYDHINRGKLVVSSGIIALERNGETPTEFSFIPEGDQPALSPYLYKLLTIDGFLSRVGGEKQLNAEGYAEIASIFNCEPAELGYLLAANDSDRLDLIFRANINPAIASRLLEVAITLRGYLPTEDDKMISVLFLAADPTDASRLRLGEEFRAIQEKLQLAKLREQFRLELPRLSLRPADISQALLDVQPRIVHFSGHGTSTGALCFENEMGTIHLVQPDALAALFKQFAQQVDCVFLNACYAEKQAKAIAQYINYVIGMSQAISDEAAIAFTIGFYQALGAGRTIDEAYELGCVQIRLQGIPEYLTPVLIKKGVT